MQALTRMIRRTLLAALCAFAATGAAAADPTTRDPLEVPAGTYELDPRHASLLVKVPHMGFSKYTLRFNKLSGSFTYDPANWQATRVRIEVDPRSADTGDSFGKTIVGYFDPEKYPQIIFESTSVTGEAGRGQMQGDLTMHGVTKPVTLDFEFNGAGPGVLGSGVRMGFSGSGKVNRREFGVSVGLLAEPFAGNVVDLLFEVEFVKK